MPAAPTAGPFSVDIPTELPLMQTASRDPYANLVVMEIKDLIIPAERQRKEFDETKLLELAQSIEKHGLFHAIQIRSDSSTLVSGERRLRAIMKHLLPFKKSFMYNGLVYTDGWVPVVVASSTDPLTLEEIELAENLQRENLTWQEMATTTSRLHNLRVAQAKLKIADAEEISCPPLVSHTIAQTAIEVRGSAVGEYQETTRKEILVAKHMDKPEVAGAATLKDAFKALKAIEDHDRNRALAAIVGETYRTDIHRIYQRDCIDWMQDEVPSGGLRFDVILTDPPYGMDAQDFGDAGGKMTGIEHHYDDSPESWLALMKQWCPLSYALAKEQAHAYVFCDIDRFHALKAMMQSAGWYVFRTPLTVYKRNSGRVPLPDRGPRRQTEWCLYAIKGKKQVTAIYSDMLPCDADEQLSHGAQKPVALYEDLLRRSVRPGDTVLDTFGGTGTLLPAAHGFKCSATIIEQDAGSYGICLKRAQDLGKQGELLP